MNINGLNHDRAWDYENGFYWFSHPSRLNKALAHYELYKQIVDLPGHVFEFGVYKAASLIRWASYRQALENEFSRKIVGFDAFGKFPTEGLKLAEDLRFVDEFEEEAGDGLQKQEVVDILSGKNFSNVFLEQGNVFETLPSYLKRFPETRISMLHLDMDVKEPTEFALDLLYDRIVPHGLIVFDDYNAAPGASDVFDALALKYGLKIEKLPLYHVPAFVRKM